MTTNVQETVQVRGAWGVAIHGVAEFNKTERESGETRTSLPLKGKDIIFHLTLHLDWTNWWCVCVLLCACVCVCVCVCSHSVVSDSLPVHGIFQARILGWIAISYSRGSSWPRDPTCVSCVSCIGRWILYHHATWEDPVNVDKAILFIKQTHKNLWWSIFGMS